MSQVRTASILQRMPVILAVTAASYGLPTRGVQAPQANAKPTDKARDTEAASRQGTRLQGQH